jgi:predicted nucleotidyltransferase
MSKIGIYFGNGKVIDKKFQLLKKYPYICAGNALFYFKICKLMNDILMKIAQLKPLLKRDYHLPSIGVFGSVSDGTFNEKSDVDILVEFSKPIGWKVFSMGMFLEKQLQRKIDLVTKNALKPQLRNQILNSVIYI